MSFADALRVLESRHGLPPLEDSEEEDTQVEESFGDHVLSSWETSLEAMATSLRIVTEDSEGLDIFKLCEFWEEFDRISVLVERAEMSPEDGAVQMEHLRGTFRGWMGYGTR
jgi:hypothetical protein